MNLSIIVAIANNGIIGKDNKLPWDIPEDKEYFYKIIYGKPVVMGHKTYNSIGKPIKNSENIVLSADRFLQLPGCLVVHSIDEVLALYQNTTQEVMVIGGASIYQQFLPLVNKIYLTLIDSDIDGDSYFPEWQKEEWLITAKRNSRSDRYCYSFLILEKKEIKNMDPNG